MRKQLPKVEIELYPSPDAKPEKRHLVYDFYAAKMIADAFPGKGLSEVLQEQVHVALPVMLHALLSHEQKDETPDDFLRMLGPANAEYLAGKIAEAVGMEAKNQRPTEAKAKPNSSTGGDLRPSQLPN